LENPYSPDIDPSSQTAPELSRFVIAISVVLGIATGVFLELILTDIRINASNILALLALSPIVLTVGGGHFPDAGEVRFLFVLLGVFSCPTILLLIFNAYRRCTLLRITVLWLVTSAIYFGVIHKTLAVMSV
jgi:hypothetical protein